jgi:hypothetical protein
MGGSKYCHFNGLPPAGPRLCTMQLKEKEGATAPTRGEGMMWMITWILWCCHGEYECVSWSMTFKKNTLLLRTSNPIEFEHVTMLCQWYNIPPAKFIKLEPGEIEDVVQSKKGNSEDFRQWSFECALAIPNDEVQAAEPRNYEEVPVEKVEQGDPPPFDKGWRCRKCYETRFQTMCFGMNEGMEGGRGRLKFDKSKDY